MPWKDTINGSQNRTMKHILHYRFTIIESWVIGKSFQAVVWTARSEALWQGTRRSLGGASTGPTYLVSSSRFTLTNINEYQSSPFTTTVYVSPRKRSGYRNALHYFQSTNLMGIGENIMKRYASNSIWPLLSGSCHWGPLCTWEM